MVKSPKIQEGRNVVAFFSAEVMDDTVAHNSSSFYCEPFNTMLVEIYMPDTTGAPTDILIDLEWSDDNSTFYHYQHDFWGDMRWEDVGAPYTESVSVPILAPYVRFTATSQGGAVGAYFTLTLKGVFSDK